MVTFPKLRAWVASILDPWRPCGHQPLLEVARLAGVSVTTASRAVNGRDPISDVTRKRVLKAARELAYKPNLVAKSLVSGKSSIIGVVLRDPLVQRFAMPIILGAQSVVEQREFSAIIADAKGQADRLADLAVAFHQRNIDGLLVVGDNTHPTPSVTGAAKLPTVYVHGPTTDPRDVVHDVDDLGGAFAVVKHLAKLGRRRIAHITGPDYSAAVQQRVLGVRRALQEHGLELVADIRYGPWSQRWARQARHTRCWTMTPSSTPSFAGRTKSLSAFWRRLSPLAARCPTTWPSPGTTTGQALVKKRTRP